MYPQYYRGWTAVLSKSPNPDKKWRVVVTDGEKQRTIDFGAVGYGDFMMFTASEGLESGLEHRDRYIDRHSSREDWTDPFTAGFWSRWVLWNNPTIEASIKTLTELGMEVVIRSSYLPDKRASTRNSKKFGFGEFTFKW